MAIENLQDIVGAINSGTPQNRRDLAAAIRGVENQLSNFEDAATQAESDARRVVAIEFIVSDVTPLLTNSTTGDYALQHGQLLVNIEIVNGFFVSAPNVETTQELKKLKAGELDKLRILKQQHAQGII
ncbi:MAG: hypothetical protein GY821_12740 [Gammaproteobacteria bacterium]|nr:hypothetical protein [Gammaproteobacteria bacterium]